MKWPTTVRGWLELIMAGLALLASLAAGGAWLYHNNAWASDVQHVVASVKTLRCDILNQQIQQLEHKEAAGTITPREKAWLQDLLRQWQAHCTSGG